MRHNKSGRRLGRTTSHRVAMFRNMVTSFLTHEKIVTTDAKAKEIRPIAEKMITLGKRGDLHALRQASAFIRDRKTVHKLFSIIAPRYAERCGGYTRIVKLGLRPGDAAPLSVIELVEQEIASLSAKKTKSKDSVVSGTIQNAAVATEEKSDDAKSDAQSTELEQAAGSFVLNDMLLQTKYIS